MNPESNCLEGIGAEGGTDSMSQGIETGARTADAGGERSRILKEAEMREPSASVRWWQSSSIQHPHSGPQIVRRRLNSRRGFLKVAIGSLALPALWMMQRIASRTESLPENSETTVTVPWSTTQGIRFHDRMIVINGSSGVRIFSSTCSHLGCRINRAEGTDLVCPCHGSRYNQLGEVVRGPATRGLRPLPFTLDRANALLRVTLET